MRRAGPAAVLLLASLPLGAADPALVDGVSGAPVQWTEWVSRRAPVAVLLWASWVPEAEQTLEAGDELAAAAEAGGTGFTIVAVQEPLEDARRALEGVGVPWFHDRHGSLLKSYRVIDVPSIVILAADNTVIHRSPPSAAALQAWRGQ